MQKFLAGTAFGVFLTLLCLSPLTRAAQQSPSNQNERTITLLNDPKALESLQRSGGLRVIWWKNGDKFVSLGQPRWIIPGKVKPAISGDSVGAEYYFFDSVTGLKQGPFKPDAQ